MFVEAADAASNGTDWTSVVALAAVLVSGLAVWTNRADSKKRLQQERDLHREQLEYEERESEKRLAHEERMQAQRLAHERQETLKTTAARALRRTHDSLRLYYRQQVKRSDDVDDAELRAAAADSIQALSEVTAWGWTEGIRSAAERVEVLLSFLPFAPPEDDGVSGDRKAREAHRAALDALNDFHLALTTVEVSTSGDTGAFQK